MRTKYFCFLVSMTHLLATHWADATIIEVPSQELTIAAGIGAASTGDTVLVTDSGTYGAIDLNKDILVTADVGEAPLIDEASTLRLGEVRGLTFRRLSSGGESFVVRAESLSDVLLMDCTVEAESDTLGVDGFLFYGGDFVLKGCTIQNVDYPVTPIQASSGRMRFEQCLILTENGPSMELSGKVELVESTMLSVYDNIAGNDYAFFLSGGRDAKIQGSIIGGFEIVFDVCPSDTVESNLFYNYSTFGCGSISDTDNILAGNEGAGYPLFCEEREGAVQEYTLRIDSPAAAGNHAFGIDIGAFPVECAWGTLARATVVEENVEALVLEDITVPSSGSLTLKKGSELKFDGDDGSPGGGNDTSLNELFVEGGLTISGHSASKAKLTSSAATPAEGDWKGIWIEDGAVGKINYAEITYAVEGVLADEKADTVSVTNSTFSNNELSDIESAGDNLAVVTISSNSITVGGGTGIDLSANKGVVSNNTITCNSSTVKGVHFEALSSDQHLTGNTVTGCSNGAAVYVAGGANKQPNFRSNTLTTSKYGFEITISHANVGLQDSPSYKNTITNNTAGILAYGNGTNPKIRTNDITSNSFGIVIQGGANPDIGDSSDTGSSLGKNKLTGNTTYCLWNRNTSGTIEAEGNYFGGCDPFPEACWEGSFNLTFPLCTAPFGVAIDMFVIAEEPRGLRLLGVRPNPIRSGGTIGLALGEGRIPVGVQIFDLQGRLVRDFGERNLSTRMRHSSREFTVRP
jgi:hypothetical protein